jgi:hypothetical protein
MGYLALLQPSSASFRAGVSGLPGTAARLSQVDSRFIVVPLFVSSRKRTLSGERLA